MNLPNKLTLFRLILVPFTVLLMIPVSSLGNCMWNQFVQKYGMILALILFSIASITDHLDGALARRRGEITNFGKLMDPIADKVLVLSVLIAFVALKRIHALVPILILFREFTVTGIRLLSIERGIVIAASRSGKIKTVFQIVSIILFMVHAIALQWLPVVEAFLWWPAELFVIVSVILTLYSGAQYVHRSRCLFQGSFQEDGSV